MVTTELLRVAVNSLVAVAENMNRVIVDTQSKILHDYVERNGGRYVPRTVSRED